MNLKTLKFHTVLLVLWCFVFRIVSLLVSATSRAKLRHSWISPLHLAAQHDRHAAAAALLKTGADVNATLAHSRSVQYADRRATALYFAVAHGSRRTAEVLVNAGASLSLDPVSPLLMAARQGCVSTVTLLLERGADLDATIPSLVTTFPALVALCRNNLAVLKCLLDHGCDAQACFTCTHGAAPHPPSGGSDIRTAGGHDCLPPLSCDERPERATQVGKTNSPISHWQQAEVWTYLILLRLSSTVFWSFCL